MPKRQTKLGSEECEDEREVINAENITKRGIALVVEGEPVKKKNKGVRSRWSMEITHVKEDGTRVPAVLNFGEGRLKDMIDDAIEILKEKMWNLRAEGKGNNRKFIFTRKYRV
ncbi:hypothetical protein AKJ39_02865 [candidate division MSBL1 archaeon SCGC-AAA259J03]|uniref:Uncharacterized protein n=1 Tax=candidate division MSBL1 archaeon SCGC-AAA259J03 TaxID=1698269 RepID=A0A656YWP2_9EURY|nr:hypothetical protein AKJ39_02865 [candidate division MSBL1 archaeon SCGC-AAA259J03]